MFFRNSVLCKRLTETDIDKIFSTAIISKNSEHNELIVTMTIIIEVYGYLCFCNKFMFSQSTRPARPVQEYVARLILHHSTCTLKSLLGQEMKSARTDILRKEVCRIHANPHVLFVLCSLKVINGNFVFFLM